MIKIYNFIFKCKFNKKRFRLIIITVKKLIDKILFKIINVNLNRVYKKNIDKFGFTASGLFWSSRSSQYKRFKVLLCLIEKFVKKKKPSIADLGCGFGDFLLYLKKYSKNSYEYSGYDINPEMIEYCKKKFSNFFFKVSSIPVEKCDLTLISGTYNYAVIDNVKLWERYLLFNLKQCYNQSYEGVIFNLQFSRKSKIINNIYYTNHDSMNIKLNDNFKRVYSFYDKNTENDMYYVILKN